MRSPNEPIDPDDPDRRAVALARTQHGLLARRQAIEIGLDDRRIRTRLRRGQWEAARSGVYVVGAAPSTWEQRVMAVVLAAGPHTLASHRTAARLWGLVERSGRIEILLPHERRVRLPDVQVHRSRLLVGDDATVRSGIPTTSLDRTIADVAPWQSPELMGRWIDAGLRDHRLDLGRLAATCSRLTFPGHPAPRSAMAALVLRSDGYDPGRTALESRALAAIARAGLPAPVRQHEVERSPGKRAFIDLAYPDVRLAIELDGWETHGIRSAFDADRIRANDLVLLGWSVLRFTWTMSDAYLCDTVRRALAAR